MSFKTCEICEVSGAQMGKNGLYYQLVISNYQFRYHNDSTSISCGRNAVWIYAAAHAYYWLCRFQTFPRGRRTPKVLPPALAACGHDDGYRAGLARRDRHILAALGGLRAGAEAAATLPSRKRQFRPHGSGLRGPEATTKGSLNTEMTEFGQRPRSATSGLLGAF